MASNFDQDLVSLKRSKTELQKNEQKSNFMHTYIKHRK